MGKITARGVPIASQTMKGKAEVEERQGAGAVWEEGRRGKSDKGTKTPDKEAQKGGEKENKRNKKQKSKERGRERNVFAADPGAKEERSAPSAKEKDTMKGAKGKEGREEGGGQ